MNTFLKLLLAVTIAMSFFLGSCRSISNESPDANVAADTSEADTVQPEADTKQPEPDTKEPEPDTKEPEPDTKEPENNPPLAIDDLAETTAGVEITIQVLSNDIDDDNDVLKVVAVTQGEHGLIEIIFEGDLLKYTPSDSEYVGTDSFDYTVKDGKGGEDTATVTVNIAPAPLAPTLTITAPAGNEVVDGAPTITFEVENCNFTHPSNDPAGCHAHVAVDGKKWSPQGQYVNEPFTLKGLISGEHTVTLTLVRNDGSDQPFSPVIQDKVTFVVEGGALPPSITITSPLDDEVLPGTSPVITFEVTGCNFIHPSKDKSGCHGHRLLNGLKDSPYGQYVYEPFALVGLESGKHTFKITLIKNDGTDQPFSPLLEAEVTFIIDLCSSNPCQNGGTCSDEGTGLPVCDCTDTGFSGETCETNIDDCDPNPCQNGGVCTDAIGSYTCDCTDTGFEGDTCGVPGVDECDFEPCQNGGVCTDAIGSYTCDCTDTGFEGDTCESNIDDCAPNPCQNGGVCIDGVNSYACDCTDTGFTGDTCESNIDDCDPNPCQNGGECIDGVNSAGCDCTDTGFTGDTCEEAEEASYNGCTQSTATDYTGTDPVVVQFDLSIGTWCGIVSAGTSFEFQGDFGTHPLTGGLDNAEDETSPISNHVDGDFTLNEAGIYGFFCEIHSSMKGAIFVE